MPAWIGSLIILSRKLGAWCVGRYYGKRFACAGDGIRIGHGFVCRGPERIRLGDRVTLAHHAEIYALTGYPWSEPPQRFEPTVDIGADVFINSYTVLSAAHRIVVEDEVMIAPHCFITDNVHGYRDATRSIRSQPLVTGGETRIGKGSQIGCGTFVQGPVTIGAHCMIGANSVVTRDIPDYCVAVGAPARIVRRYDDASGNWVPGPGGGGTHGA